MEDPRKLPLEVQSEQSSFQSVDVRANVSDIDFQGDKACNCLPVSFNPITPVPQLNHTPKTSRAEQSEIITSPSCRQRLLQEQNTSSKIASNILIEKVPPVNEATSSRKKCTTKRRGGKVKQQSTKKKFKELVSEERTCPICNDSLGCADAGEDWVECIIRTVWIHEICSCENIFILAMRYN